MLITSFIDIAFPATLACFKNYVKKYCENHKYTEIYLNNTPLIGIKNI